MLKVGFGKDIDNLEMTDRRLHQVGDIIISDKGMQGEIFELGAFRYKTQSGKMKGRWVYNTRFSSKRPNTEPYSNVLFNYNIDFNLSNFWRSLDRIVEI